MDKIIKGDMPGDKIEIGPSHRERAEKALPLIRDAFLNSGQDKFVISVYGGSGVGKSEIGSLLATDFACEGIEAYVLSGDNYPFRIPHFNDSERLNRFRYGGLRALASDDSFGPEQMGTLKELQNREVESDRSLQREHPFLKVFQENGRAELAGYLGTDQEIDFNLVNSIISDFKSGNETIALKRMGRTIDDIYFEKVDFSAVKVLIIEWTHGNNRAVQGVDFPLYLFSTPEETLAHRIFRGRDKGVDSPFVSLVLDIEQEKLNSQAERAALIISKSAEILSYEQMKERIG